MCRKFGCVLKALCVVGSVNLAPPPFREREKTTVSDECGPSGQLGASAHNFPLAQVPFWCKIGRLYIRHRLARPIPLVANRKRLRDSG